jgi:hypothetical protein
MDTEELFGLFNPEQEKLLDTYSVEQLENLAIEHCSKMDENKNTLALRRIMINRRKKLNHNFTWSREDKEKIICLNNMFLRVFKKAFDEAEFD